MTDPAPRFRDKPVSFVRRSGRMSDAQERAWQDLSAHYVIDVERDAAATSVRPGTQIAPGAVFGRRAPLVVEIGSGAGDQVVHAAAENPGTDFIALEVWRPGIAQTISKAVHAGVTNVRLIEIDASEALDRLFAPGSVAEVWTFFPDPWPKSKHHKRRLVQPGFAEVVASEATPVVIETRPEPEPVAEVAAEPAALAEQPVAEVPASEAAPAVEAAAEAPSGATAEEIGRASCRERV